MSLNETIHTIQNANNTIDSLLFQLETARNMLLRYHTHYGNELPAVEMKCKDSIVFGWHLSDDDKMIIDVVDAENIGDESYFQKVKKQANLLTK